MVLLERQFKKACYEELGIFYPILICVHLLREIKGIKTDIPIIMVVTLARFFNVSIGNKGREKKQR